MQSGPCRLRRWPGQSRSGQDQTSSSALHELADKTMMTRQQQQRLKTREQIWCAYVCGCADASVQLERDTAGGLAAETATNKAQMCNRRCQCQDRCRCRCKTGSDGDSGDLPVQASLQWGSVVNLERDWARQDQTRRLQPGLDMEPLF